jgi:hypothetical protein
MMPWLNLLKATATAAATAVQLLQQFSNVEVNVVGVYFVSVTVFQ